MEKIIKTFSYKGVKVIITEPNSVKGYQFHCRVNGISLGCLPNELLAGKEAIAFINKTKGINHV